MSKASEHHHTVPKTYLKGFADSGGLIDVWRRGDIPRRPIHISNVTVRSGFYNAHDEDGLRHDEVEQWFSRQVESPVGPVLTRLRENGPQPVEGGDAVAITEFVAAQALRTVTVRNYMEEVDEDLGPRFLLDHLLRLYGDGLMAIEPRHMSALIRKVLHDATDPHEVRRSHLRTTVREIPKLVDRISHYRWHTADADRSLLITGDAPVVVLQRTLTSFSGIVPRGSPIYVPLTPTRLLVGDPSTRGRPAKVTELLARVVNTRISYGATDVILKACSQAWPQSLPFAAIAPSFPPPVISTAPASCGTLRRQALATAHEHVRGLLDVLGGP